MTELRKATLTDLEPADVNVIVTLADGEEVLFEMRTLSYLQYNQIRWSVADPAPPASGVDKQGRPVFNYNDPGYLRARLEAETTRQYKVLLASLKLDIPGDTEADKLTYLQTKLDTAIGQQLMVLAIRLANQGDARIATRAESFPNGHAVPGDNAGALATA